MIRFIETHILPPECLLCRGEVQVESGICRACRDDIRPLPKPTCALCGIPLGTPGVCLACQADRPPFDRMLSAACYETRLREMLHAFKYRRGTVFKSFLGHLLLDALSGEDFPIDVVTSVPLHWKRLIQRGYNQSALLARELSGTMGIACNLTLIRKQRNTRVQMGLDRASRARNLKGAFRAAGVSGTAVLVVDDVITTGQTAREIASTLKRAGAAFVAFISVGRVVT